MFDNMTALREMIARDDDLDWLSPNKPAPREDFDLVGIQNASL
jgi:hypothetical protein